MKNRQKLLLIISIILVVLIIIFFVGNSFGFFRYLKKGDIVNVITIGGIDVQVIDQDSDALNLENAYPISDDDGLKLTPFEFKMTNSSNQTLIYSLVVELDTDKLNECKLEDGTSCKELSTKYIKYAFKKNDGTCSTPANLATNGNVITKDIIESKASDTYSLIVWIDEDAGNEIMNTYFFGKLIISAEKYVAKNLGDTILKDNELITVSPTLTTSSNKTTDASGLYVSTDTNSGNPTYYFRGDVTNNYVSFAEKIWRIVRINEDGTVRLISQDIITNDGNGYIFNTDYNNYTYMYYSDSQLRNYVDQWFNDNIGNNSKTLKYVSSGEYYCEQAKVKINDNYTSGTATMTLYSNYIPDFKCKNDENNKGIVSSNVGLITYDEAVYAGAYVEINNKNFYLYNNSSYWFTISPNGVGTSYAYIWSISSGGTPYSQRVNTNNSIRPVINLKSDTPVTGIGTSTDPYLVLS